MYGWLPVNVKSTTTLNADNIGNMTTCVQSLTPYNLILDKSYKNRPMSEIILNSLETKAYNKNHKKDYYFLVLNKKNPEEIIVNSIKGLTEITPNNNNLPFQIKWCINKQFNYTPIKILCKKILTIWKKPPPSWSEKFLNNIRKIK